MSAIPKPPRRGPKPRRPIPRRRLRGRRRANPFAAHRKLKKLVDDTFALVVRVRDSNRCRLCNANSDTQCAHLISRRYEQCRVSLDNAWCLCRRCHARWTHDPLGWDELMERAFGPVEWAKRKSEAQIPVRPDWSALRLVMKWQLVDVLRGGAHGLDVQAERILARHEEWETTHGVLEQARS